ncbi:hybrid sensor histidine kinase/response regulator [Pseudoalteromonas sp. A601]|uniref:PAS domain-containing hybrid sensor histidine kinase/response regulator n=1 Tax=Pseudoalteromonas sp. A601 TaxID=1967839 RepID=UPI000B3CE9F6|nr:ATP-binding protein [Pseudoalteromonas sp. A601]OUS70201.1 hybrid sensor histidine kinase/response regulator [Pseudoalteromonas sp. A601]
MDFLPLKHYYRSLAVALIVPLLVAFVLCLHLYNIKLERTITKHHADFDNLAAQLSFRMEAAESLVKTLLAQYEQPLYYHFDQQWLKDVNQFNDYYYRKIPQQGGEIVGQGRFSSTPQAIAQWQQVIALGPAFNTALSLIKSLSAVAYVNEQGFAYVKRRNENTSLFITQILDNQFKPNFRGDMLSSSAVVALEGKDYFAVGQRRSATSRDYVILIYDLQLVSAWLAKISSDSGEYIFITESQQVIASSTKAVKTYSQLNQYWPILNIDKTLEKRFNDNSLVLFQPPQRQPVYAGFYESQQQLVSPIRYEAFIEFIFLSVFLIMMFSGIFWLSRRIFVKPITHLMAYLEQSEEYYSDSLDYQVPVNWQPWFGRIKAVLNKNKQLVNSLQQSNLALDNQIKIKTKELARSYEAKERHLALLNTMLNSVPDLIYFKNIDGSFLGCNRAYEQYIGVEQGQLVGLQLCDISDDSSHLIELERQVLKSRSKAELRIESGEKLFRLSIAPFYNEQNHLLGTMGVGRDITVQQEALTALKASESKFRSAIEYAANAVVLLSLEHTILQLNKAARHLFKIDKHQHSQLFSSFFSPAQWQEIESLLGLLLTEKKKVYHLTLAQQQSNCWWQLSVSLVWDEQRAPYYYVFHIQDVSALTQAKQNAERATQAKSRFIANLSHEIRTPLNAVTGLIDMIAQQGLSPQQGLHASQAKQSAQNLLTMLNRMLDFARIESNQVQLELVDFSLVDLVDSCESLLLSLCPHKGLWFNIEVDPTIPVYLAGDFIRLQQVIGNLLTNAVKFTECGGVTLKIEKSQHAENDSEAITFCIIDTGIGIEKNDQKRLFDAFTQGDESLTRKHQGVGLGLAIVKYELDLMGSEIELISRKNKGSEFYFTISFSEVSDKKEHNFDWRNTIVIASEADQKQLEPTMRVVMTKPRFRTLAQIIPWFNEAPHNNFIVNDSDLDLLLSEKTTKDILNKRQTKIFVIKTNSAALNKHINNLNISYVSRSALAQRLLVEASNTQQQNQVITQAKTDLSGLLVLVIDDNQLNLDIMCNVLAQAGINALVANSALKGINLIEKIMPDLILMDIQMPEVDGLQAAKILRKKYSSQQLPIFALTAHCEKEDEERSFAAGMNKHLTKPIVAHTLLQAISEVEILPSAFFDRTFALSQFAGDNDLLLVMVDKLAELCKTQLDKLKVEQQPETVERLVHSIKGVSGNLGFIRLSLIAQQLEVAIRSSKNIAPQLFNQLIIELEQVIAFIQIQGTADVEESESTDRR